MLITLVIDSYQDKSNGVAMTTERFANVFIELGHEVQIIAGQVDSKGKLKGVSLGVSKVPVLYQVSKMQGFYFAKCKKKAIKEAILKSDVVHFLFPFKIERYGKKICDKYHIPSTAAFHLLPENITSTIRLNTKVINDLIYKKFRNFYNKFSYVHCPSQMTKKQLLSHGYTSNLEVISNGISPKFRKIKVEKPAELKDKFVILMIGRLSVEKRQDLIIEAVNKLPFKDKVQLIFAGKGPEENRLSNLAKNLPNPPIFKFFNQDDLLNLINTADLYIHASDAEIEGMSSMEAFACGLVPIFSDSDLSAGSQFALDENNLFKNGDSTDLANKITYWYRNSEQRAKRGEEYIAFAKNYSLETSVKALVEVFKKAIAKEKE